MAQPQKPIKRIDPELDKIIRQVLGKRMLRGENVKYPRITKAIANQYRKYPQMLKELEEENLI